MIELSIILITWNSERFVSDCLASVFESTNHISREIILVDNGSTDTTQHLIQPYTHYPEFIFVSKDKNSGVSKARNIGIQQAKGKYIWLLDIDTIINREAVTTLMNFIRINKDCGICGCKLMNSRNEIQDSCRKYPSLRHKILNVLETILIKCNLAKSLKDRIYNLNQAQFYRKQMNETEPFDVEYVIGACQLIRKEVIKQVGLLDEHIFYGPEDADFCLRTREKGWKVMYLPAVSFVHEYQQITSKRLFSYMSLIHTKALFYFFWKHKRF